MAQEIKTCKQDLNMTEVIRKEVCQTINRSSKHANEHVCAKEDLEMLAVMFARTVPVANKEAFVPTSARKWNAKGLPTNYKIQKSVTPNALEMLTVMFARTVQVANKKCSCQPQQRNVMLKCYPQTPQPQNE